MNNLKQANLSNPHVFGPSPGINDLPIELALVFFGCLYSDSRSVCYYIMFM